MSRHVVCRVEELPPGARKIIDVRGRAIGVFNVNGAYYALLNRCPHRAAPLCKGPVTGLVSSPAQYKIEFSRDGEIVRCPWHGWEFDITTGQSVFNPHRVRAKSYEVTLEPVPDCATGAATRVVGPDEDDPSIETFPVSIEQEVVVVHIGHSQPARRPVSSAAPADAGPPGPDAAAPAKPMQAGS